MKTVKISGLVALLASVCLSQVLNTAQTLKPGRFALTAAPLIYMDNDPKPGAYAMFGAGIGTHVDLGLSARLGRNRTLLGADIEWGILHGMPSLSLTAGIHGFDFVGTDMVLMISVPTRVITVSGGADTDIDFMPDDVLVKSWGFANVEIRITRIFRLIIEQSINIRPRRFLSRGPHIFGAGAVLLFP